jgi:uncharacterized protein YndB with AHSA1/START domain
MNQSRFVYVTFIRTTPSKLWQALTDPKIVRQWRFGMIVECDWKKGSSWKMTRADGTLTDSGQIQEIDPPRRIVIHWQVEWMQDLKAEGPSRCIFELEPANGAVKLSLTHEMDRPKSQFIAAVSVGWPMVLSNLKSLLETGEVVLTSHPGH